MKELQKLRKFMQTAEGRGIMSKSEQPTNKRTILKYGEVIYISWQI